MTRPRVLTRTFWENMIDPTVRSAAQGFLTGAGITAGVGDFTVLSAEAVSGGIAGALSMAALAVLFALAAGPTNRGRR